MTTIKNAETIVNPENPFENCKLNRKQYADILTAIVNTYSNGFVLGLNGAWGTGKTTFLAMWQQQLINDGYRCISINAWENDFVDDPMSMILGEFYSQLIKDEEKDSEIIAESFKELLKVLLKITQKVAPKILANLVKKNLGVEGADIIKAISEESLSIINEDIKKHGEKRDAFKEFKVTLKRIVNELSADKPIVVLVDELDRCKPSFAVQVLEKIKHLFEIEGLVFVLSVDVEQLSHSVRGYYGSDMINAEEYLRRFINLWYDMPSPDYAAFCNHLYEYYGFAKYFEDDERLQYRDFNQDVSDMENILCLITAGNNLSLRQIEKLFIRTKVALNCFQKNQHILPGVFFTYVYLKEFKPEIYERMKAGGYSIQELTNVFETMIVRGYDDDKYEGIWERTFALFICMYQKQLNDLSGDRNRTNIAGHLINSNENEKSTLRFIINKLNKEWLPRLIEHYTGHVFDGPRIVPMHHLVNKLELLESFKI